MNANIAIRLDVLYYMEHGIVSATLKLDLNKVYVYIMSSWVRR